MKATTEGDGSVISELFNVHYGHEMKLGLTWLSRTKREQYGAKLSMKISKKEVLNSIRKEVGASYDRSHLTTLKDLENIKRAFGLDEIQLHPNDQVSVRMWIDRWARSDDNPILYFKLQGTEDKESGLEQDDFIIIAQNKFQSELMKAFAEKGMCCDATHGTTHYDFKLTSLLVLDEFSEGIPIGYCLSNKETYEAMKVFFTKVKEKTGVVHPAWFMSDLAPQFYTAFVEVNECCPKKLACTWHVDKNWRKELKEKVKEFEVNAILYKSLRTLLTETDPLVLEDRLNLFLIKCLNNKETKAFGTYFQTYWLPKKKEWAYCYRLGDGINTNMFCEAFHRVFKHNYLGGKKGRRVDKCLYTLLEFNHDKVFERMIKLEKGKYSSRMRYIYDSHQSGLAMPISSVSEDGKGSFVVKSQYHDTYYNVRRGERRQNCNDCKMVCQDCKVCVHQFSCTCIDYLLKLNICKHIHLLIRYFTDQTRMLLNKIVEEIAETDNVSANEQILAATDRIEREDTSDVDDIAQVHLVLYNIVEKICKPNFDEQQSPMYINPDEDARAETSNAGVGVQSLFAMVANDQSSLERLREDARNHALEIISNINICTDVDALRSAAKNLSMTKNAMMSLMKFKPTAIPPLPKAKYPHNAKIDTQRTFFSTTRSKQDKPNNRLQKPTFEEKKNFDSTLDALTKSITKPIKDNVANTQQETKLNKKNVTETQKQQKPNKKNVAETKKETKKTNKKQVTKSKNESTSKPVVEAKTMTRGKKNILKNTGATKHFFFPYTITDPNLR